MRFAFGNGGERGPGGPRNFWRGQRGEGVDAEEEGGEYLPSFLGRDGGRVHGRGRGRRASGFEGEGGWG